MDVSVLPSIVKVSLFYFTANYKANQGNGFAAELTTGV